MLGFFAVIRKIYTHLLSAAGTLLTRFRGTTAPKQPRAISSSVKRTPALCKAEAPGFPAIPLEKAVLPADVEAQLAAVNWDRRDVLVGTLRNAAQLKACLDGRFYYIPAALVTEEDKPIHYVALFQTPRVFPGHAGIFWYGAVQRSALVERGSILEVPQTHGSPDAPYYRYQICQWLPLPTPIRPREAGFVRAFTNLFLLENAEFIPELLLGSEEEYRLFLELKRRVPAAPPEGTASGFAWEDIRVILADGNIRMFRAEQALGSCSIQSFIRYPFAAFRQLYTGQASSQRAGPPLPPVRQIHDHEPAL